MDWRTNNATFSAVPTETTMIVKEAKDKETTKKNYFIDPEGGKVNHRTELLTYLSRDREAEGEIPVKEALH